MIKVNGNEYKLLLLDTNALSNFLKNPNGWIEYINKNFPISNSVICYSVFSLIELAKSKTLFDSYVKFFSVFPSVILDGYEAIFNKEMKLYDNSDHELNPITITPFALYDKNISSPEVRLRNVLKLSRFYERTDYWIKSRESILENIINLKNNFKPAGEKYTKKEIKEFVDLVSIQQVILRNLEFAQNTVNIEKKEIDINQFPSIITKSYVVFYKFYSDNKRPSSSDVIDIIIASLLPYVDFFITEGHLCEIIKKVQSIHNYLTNLQSFSIRQIMKEINSSGV